MYPIQGLSTKLPERPEKRKRPSRRNKRRPPLGAGFGGYRKRDIGKETVRHTVDIVLPSIQEEPSQTSSFRKMPKTSLFFRPSKKLAHLHDKATAEQRFERIKIAAGLRTRDQVDRTKGVWNVNLDPATSTRGKMVLPPLRKEFGHGDSKYGSSHYSVFDPLGQLNPVDMNLQTNIGRPELSPSIGYRSGPDGLTRLNPRKYAKMSSKLKKLKYQNMTREEKEEYKEKRRQKRIRLFHT